MIFEIADLESLDRFSLKIAICLIFMKFGNYKKSNMLIMNILIGIDYHDWKLEICELYSNFYKIWHWEQIEHADYEYSTWNWLAWPKIIYSGKFSPNTEICSDFYEIWHSKQIEHAYYGYNNISQCLERLHDYMFRMIVSSEHGTIIRTIIIVPIIVPCSKWLYVVKFDPQPEHD